MNFRWSCWLPYSLALHPIYGLIYQSLLSGHSPHLRVPFSTWILFPALVHSYISHLESALVQSWVSTEERATLRVLNRDFIPCRCWELPFLTSFSLSGFFKLPYLTMLCCFAHQGNSWHDTQAVGFPGTSIIWQEFLYVQMQSCTLTTNVHWWDCTRSAALCSSISANKHQLSYSN